MSNDTIWIYANIYQLRSLDNEQSKYNLYKCTDSRALRDIEEICRVIGLSLNVLLLFLVLEAF